MPFEQDEDTTNQEFHSPGVSYPSEKVWRSARFAYWLARFKRSKTATFTIMHEQEKMKFIYIGDRLLFLENRIGTGASGVVYRAYDQEGCEFAVKREYLTNINMRSSDKPITQTQLGTNYQALNNLLVFHQGMIMAPAHEDPDEVARYTLMDYHGPENFAEYLKTGISVLNGIFACLETLLSLELIHASNAGHFDFNPQNLIHQFDKSGHIVAMVPVDFETGAIFSKNQPEISLSHRFGAFPFVAPEILHETPCYSREADLFSLGVMFAYFTPILGIRLGGKAYQRMEGERQLAGSNAHGKGIKNENLVSFLKGDPAVDTTSQEAQVILRLLSTDRAQRVSTTTQGETVYTEVRQALLSLAEKSLVLTPDEKASVKQRVTDHMKLLKFIESHQENLKKSLWGNTNLNFFKVGNNKNRFLDIYNNSKRKTWRGTHTRTYKLLVLHGWLSKTGQITEEAPQEMQTLQP